MPLRSLKAHRQECLCYRKTDFYLISTDFYLIDTTGSLSYPPGQFHQTANGSPRGAE
jgi:hypothetical protein